MAESEERLKSLLMKVNCSMLGLSAHRQLLEFTQTHVRWVGDAIWSSYPLSSPSPPVFNLSQNEGLFQWVSLSFKPALSFSSFSLIKRLLLLAFFHKCDVIFICEVIVISPSNLNFSFVSSSPAFHMMYCEYKLNKQGDNIQPWHTPFPIWNQSVVPCPVLTVAFDLHTDFSGGR